MFETEDFVIQMNKTRNSKGTMTSVQVTVSSQYAQLEKVNTNLLM